MSVISELQTQLRQCQAANEAARYEAHHWWAEARRLRAENAALQRALEAELTAQGKAHQLTMVMP